MQKRTSLTAVVLTLVVLLLGTSSVLAHVTAQDISCTLCHNDTTVITGKKAGLSEAVHGTGEAFGRGTRASCAGCHSGGAFSAMVAQGLRPDQIEAGDPNPTRQNCRTCHQIHTSYTESDWALETTEPVKLFAFKDVTFDRGKSNLCANCHQPRRTIDQYVDDPNGVTDVTSTHWGPHHGPQSAMLLGIGGAGDVSGGPSYHYRLIGDTCVTCHIGPDMHHTFEAIESSCNQCHSPDDDLEGVQVEIEALIVELGELLEAKGMYHDGHPVVGTYPIAEANALWNYILIAVEDGSLGTHNMPYTKALLEASIAALKE